MYFCLCGGVWSPVGAEYCRICLGRGLNSAGHFLCFFPRWSLGALAIVICLSLYLLLLDSCTLPFDRLCLVSAGIKELAIISTIRIQGSHLAELSLEDTLRINFHVMRCIYDTRDRTMALRHG